MKDLENTNKTDKEQYITTEIVRTAYKQIPGIIIINILAGPITAYIFYPYIEKSVIFTWLAVEYITCVFTPLVLLHYYKKISPDDSELKLWAQIFVALGVIGGSMWGYIGFIFFAEGNLIYQLILFFFLYTAVATAMAATAIFSAAFYALAFPMLLPIAIRSAMEGDGLHNIFSIITIIYLFSLVFFHRNIHNTLIRSLTLQLENMDMAKNLEQKNKEIELASNAKSRFLAAASHDLRQPLHAQTLFVAELQAKIKDPELLATIKHMKLSVDVMRDLFDALLDISRLDVGMVEPNLSSFDISHSFTKLKKEFLPQMQNKELRFRIASSSHIIISDKHLLERIIRNLLSNSLAYTREGSVMLCAKKRQEQLHIEVRDSGIGIPESLINTVFDEFSQLNNPERDRDKGLGLGLTIVKRLCNLLDHEIVVKSSCKSGSTFTIVVPLSKKLAIDVFPEEETLTPSRAPLNLSVLIIDDDKTILIAMYGILTHWGCKVICASSADHAEQLLPDKITVPDVIIADFRLRNNLTGIQAIQQMYDYFSKNLPALLTTGDTAKDCLLKARESKYDLLHKPVNPDELYSWLYKNKPNFHS